MLWKVKCPKGHLPASHLFYLYPQALSPIYSYVCAILFHAWNPIAYLSGKLPDGRRTSNKGEPSVKRLGNCSSAVGRPAEDDAIFEDNATTTLFCSGKFLSSRSNRWKQRKGLAPLAKRIKFEESEFGNFMVRVSRRPEIVIGLLGLPCLLYLSVYFTVIFFLEYMQLLINIQRISYFQREHFRTKQHEKLKSSIALCYIFLCCILDSPASLNLKLKYP